MNDGDALGLGNLRRRAAEMDDSALRSDLLILANEVEMLRAKRNESQRTVPELLAGYARSLAELRRRGVVRSANAPAGDYAEWLVKTALVAACPTTRRRNRGMCA